MQVGAGHPLRCARGAPDRPYATERSCSTATQRVAPSAPSLATAIATARLEKKPASARRAYLASIAVRTRTSKSALMMAKASRFICSARLHRSATLKPAHAQKRLALQEARLARETRCRLATQNKTASWTKSRATRGCATKLDSNATSALRVRAPAKAIVSSHATPTVRARRQRTARVRSRSAPETASVCNASLPMTARHRASNVARLHAIRRAARAALPPRPLTRHVLEASATALKNA